MYPSDSEEIAAKSQEELVVTDKRHKIGVQDNIKNAVTNLTGFEPLWPSRWSNSSSGKIFSPETPNELQAGGSCGATNRGWCT